MRRMILAAPVLALALAACSESSDAPVAPGAAALPADSRKDPEAGAAVYWNEVARGLVVKYTFNPFQAIRGYAVVSVAQDHAAAAVSTAREQEKPDGRPSMRAAIGAASVGALTYLFPAEAAALGTLLDQQLAAQPDGDIVAGKAAGQGAADEAVAHAKADNFFAPWSGTVPVGPGLWFSSATPPAPPIGVLFGKATPYFLTSGDQFRPPPPPKFGSPDFLAGLAEVRQISDTRTAEQDSLAKFWAFPAGTYAPAGYWNEAAAKLIVRYHLHDREAAHVFAMMNMVGFDAIIATHDAKYTYWAIRPSQADPLITLSIGLPNFPSYPSNHAALSAAMARILGSFFPAERRRLDGLANQAALSRLYGGIHFRNDNNTGLRLGRSVAAWALCVARLAGCDSDTPTTPTAAGSAALERSRPFITFAPPGNVQSQAWGIDPSGRVVVGAYRTEDDVVHGFVFERGAFTTIDYPGVAFSLVTGISGRGEMVGWWQDANGVQHGYVRRDGVFATVDAPGSVATRIDGINVSGDIVGAYDAPDGSSPGFVRRHGKFTAVEPFSGATFTVAKGISSSGDVVGYYAVNDENGEEVERHGFLLRRGTYTIIDFPGSTRTGLSAINDEGDMFGWYDDADGVTHAFLLRHGHFSTLDVPGSTFTRGNALNDRGDLVGWYDDADGVEHGFVHPK